MSSEMHFRFAESVEAATALLHEHPDEARLVCGGTAIAILLRQGLIVPTLLIGIGRIPALRTTSVDDDGTLHLGAAVRVREAEVDLRVRPWQALSEALQHVATPRIRMMATIGGGIAHGDPAQDPIIALAALDARVNVAGAEPHPVPLASFLRGYYETALAPGEMVVGVEVPRLAERSGSAYLKFLPRSVEDYGTVTAAAVIALDQFGYVSHARLVLGAVGPKPIVVPVESILNGGDANDERLREAAQLAASLVDPLHDVRGSAEYKRDMAVVFARRSLELAYARAWDVHRGIGGERAVT